MAKRYKDLSETNTVHADMVNRMRREMSRYQDTVHRLITENERLVAIATNMVPHLPFPHRTLFIDEITGTGAFEEIDLTADEDLDEA